MLTDSDKVVEIKQGNSVKRRQRKTTIIPEDLTTEEPKSKKKLEDRVKAEPYKDPNAKPRPIYKYKKVLLKDGETESEIINNVLNTCYSIVKWNEQVIQGGSVLITIIYTEKPKGE